MCSVTTRNVNKSYMPILANTHTQCDTSSCMLTPLRAKRSLGLTRFWAYLHLLTPPPSSTWEADAPSPSLFCWTAPVLTCSSEYLSFISYVKSQKFHCIFLDTRGKANTRICLLKIRYCRHRKVMFTRVVPAARPPDRSAVQRLARSVWVRSMASRRTTRLRGQKLSSKTMSRIQQGGWWLVAKAK